jgi:hypothetical protein
VIGTLLNAFTIMDVNTEIQNIKGRGATGGHRRTRDARPFRIDFGTLSVRVDVITTAATRINPQSLAGLPGKCFG